ALPGTRPPAARSHRRPGLSGPGSPQIARAIRFRLEPRAEWLEQRQPMVLLTDLTCGKLANPAFAGPDLPEHACSQPGVGVQELVPEPASLARAISRG